MEILSKNIAPSVFISSGEFALIQIIKATEGAPLFNIMGKRGHYNVGKNHPRYKHGLKGTKGYALWRNILNRIDNPKNVSFKYYGGRGISICKEWRNDPKVFISYIEKLPNYNEVGYSFDRIETNGNYEPGNVRFITPHLQTMNRRNKVSATSGFLGVRRSNCVENRWHSMITVKNEVIYLGTFSTPVEAAIARNNYILANNLTEYKLNDI